MRTRSGLLLTIVIALAGCGQSSPASPAAASPDGAATGSPPGPTATLVVTEPPASVVVEPTAVATEPPVEEPTPTVSPASIASVECLTGLTVRLRIRIAGARSVVSYQVWSTWGGGGDLVKTFPSPLPTEVDETFEFTHTLVDPVDGRIHEYGLAVTYEGVADPFLTYMFEPDGRCPGH